MNSKIQWNGSMEFTATSGSGHEQVMDASEANGGKDAGPRPKELLLNGLGGCTGMDVVSILRKMRQTPKSFRIEVEADQTEEHPMIFKKIHITFFFSGDDLDHEKVVRAVEMSQTKYCGVSEILRKSADLTYEIKYE